MAKETRIGNGRTGVQEEPERLLRRALEANRQRFTEQRAAVYRCLVGTSTHPTADDVFTCVRGQIPDISLATVYKALETLVGCGLARKLTYGDGSARYDGRTDPHHHARCLSCGKVVDVPNAGALSGLDSFGPVPDFEVEGVRVEVVGYCASCPR